MVPVPVAWLPTTAAGANAPKEYAPVGIPIADRPPAGRLLRVVFYASAVLILLGIIGMTVNDVGALTSPDRRQGAWVDVRPDWRDANDNDPSVPRGTRADKVAYGRAPLGVLLGLACDVLLLAVVLQTIVLFRRRSPVAVMLVVGIGGVTAFLFGIVVTHSSHLVDAGTVPSLGDVVGLGVFAACGILFGGLIAFSAWRDREAFGIPKR